ncbi:CocE/NonD family hydrolase [Komarekiella sp. 'clone 1']|uniref:CocE/NonD family hydrolase n=2 Tax=Komarekiella TaxID=2022127 RepID=A0AA40T1V6_9NOST|nr:CocE/NonD family hydrolase [Komarekiella delphini-convector SJRDD-AB1]
MYTRDGVRLDADIYRPDADGEFPVLLMRQPYGRAIASTVVYAHPTWYATHGYIVVIQDVRGRGTSEGEFKLFVHEIADGEDAVNWAAKLPGSNSKVGMYGFSYQGMTQLYAAAAKPPALTTICPAMIGYDLYSDWAYEGGAFCLQTNLAWAIQLATETARLQGDKTAYQALFAASRNLPLNNSEILKNLAPDSFYHEWLAHPQPDAYWEKLSPKSYLQTVDLPMFHIGGWFDTYLRGTLHLYQDMAVRNATPQHLLVGPWAHLPWGRKVGDIDFGAKAASPVDKMQIRWFDHFLKGIDTGLFEEAPVCLFEMGSNFWRTFPSLPTQNQKSYFLSTTGLASIREDSGTLSTENSTLSTTDVLVHDPWRPVPALGGHAAIPAGVFERSHIDCRSDVLTYTSEPLIEDLHLAGNVTLEIWSSADQPSYDLCAVLSLMHPDGRVFNLTQGYLHCPDGVNNVSRTIKLQATCVRIAQGNALRLSLSAACFPAYAMNGNGAVVSSNSLLNAQIITVTISCGAYPSRIVLPVVATK